MATNPRYANGHRRRNLRRDLLARGTHCAWHQCPWPEDWLGTAMANELDPDDNRFPVVDEIVHVSWGGDPLSKTNTRLLHRWCNRQRGNKPDPIPKDRPAVITSSPGWGPRNQELT
ncbi:MULTISPECIES: hypothetical protein [unclassified Agrococcus]|uniref:hypothetical protein n=1 Tax=unclassified Agrococcus TaxID=2615065 RepID=UPI003609DD9B